jgi:ADP-ribose pyrophosphatase YjhB (NUDIX family)/predicted kinase
MEWDFPLQVESDRGGAGRDDPDNLLGPVATAVLDPAPVVGEMPEEELADPDWGEADLDLPEEAGPPTPRRVLEAFAESLHPRDRLGEWAGIGFKGIIDKPLDEPPLPRGRVSSGMVLREPDGRTWVFEPKGHFGGYEHTFPKGMVEKGYSPQQNAHKELFEETGLRAEITGHLGDYKGTTGVTRFYTATRTGGEPLPPDPTPFVEGSRESAAVKLVTPEEAHGLLNMPRDKRVLKDALAVQEGTFMEGLHPRDRNGKWMDAASKIAAHGNPAEVDTLSVHAPGGQLSPEREALHRQIIHEAIANSAEQSHPTALFTAGGAASGKSSLVKQLHTPIDSIMVNPDLIKEKLPEYHLLRESGHKDIAAHATHEESSHIAAQIASIAIKGRRNVIIDGVGDSQSRKFVGKLQAAHDAGHQVTVRYAHTPVDAALAREDRRRERTGRAVPHGVLEHAHREVAQRYHDEVQHLRGVKVEIYDTNGKANSQGDRPAPKLIAEHTPGGERVVKDREKYAEFVAKRHPAVTTAGE